MAFYPKCLSSRCALCQFILIEGEHIIAGKRIRMPPGALLSSAPLTYVSTVPKEGGTSHLVCRLNEELRDSRSAVTYEICLGGCGHRDGWAPACHINCFRLVTEGRRDIQNYLKAAAYTFEPTLSKQHLRRRRLLGNLLSRWESLSDTDETCSNINNLLRRLPAELRWAIAEQLLPEYATARLTALPSVDHGDVVEISISAKVWARFVFVEGVRYIASLSNEPSSGGELIYTPTPQRILDALYLCEDHLGVRRVVLANCEETERTSECSGVWWRSYKVPTTVRLLEAHTDVSSISYGVELS